MSCLDVCGALMVHEELLSEIIVPDPKWRWSITSEIHNIQRDKRESEAGWHIVCEGCHFLWESQFNTIFQRSLKRLSIYKGSHVILVTICIICTLQNFQFYLAHLWTDFQSCYIFYHIVQWSFCRTCVTWNPSTDLRDLLDRNTWMNMRKTSEHPAFICFWISVVIKIPFRVKDTQFVHPSCVFEATLLLTKWDWLWFLPKDPPFYPPSPFYHLSHCSLLLPSLPSSKSEYGSI